MRSGRPNPVRAFPIRSITRQFDPELIVGWMYHGNLMATIAATLSGSKAPVFWSIRQSLTTLSQERWLTAAVIKAGAFLSDRPAVITYNSRTSATQHEVFGYNAERRVVIPTGFDCQGFRPDSKAREDVRGELGIHDQAVLVGLVARYHPMKNHTGFLRAVALVAGVHPSVRFVLIGHGVTEQPKVMSLIDKLRIQDRVILLGERRDTARLMAGLDIACSASSWGEGFSNAIGEAMACAVPCVVTEVGDSAYIVGNTGLCVPPQDPGAMAQAINQLVSAGSAHRKQLGIAARSRIQDNFSLPAVVAHYEALYLEHLSPGLD
jgi:glycosyltransferase involved in cell wall biosynthesis